MINAATSPVDQAAEMIRGRLGSASPVALAVVTGSGLGALARSGREIGAIPYAEIPGLGQSAVAGHEGVWRLLSLERGLIYCLSGRRHLYEGIEPPVTGLAMRVLERLGVARVLLTNAAGGLSPRLKVGGLMLIRDHLNLMFRNPLIGSEGFRDCVRSGNLYDPVLSERLREAALEEGIELKEGVYAGVSGPCYETPAEVAMYRRLGADAVGMSTVPEALTARAAGLSVAAVSLITNSHCLGANPPIHEEVLQMARQSGDKLIKLLFNWIGQAG